MTNKKVVFIDSFDEFNLSVAKKIVDTIQYSIEKRGKASIAISGGTTPIEIFKVIKEKYLVKLDTEKLNIYWVDERYVSHNHPDSNFGIANDILLRHMKKVKIFPVDTEISITDAAYQYEQLLMMNFNSKKEVPKFDLVFLGMGSDGHTASLFPNTDQLSISDKAVITVKLKQLNYHRISLTFPVLNSAKNRIIAFYGQRKLKIYSEIQRNYHKKYPIQHLNPSSISESDSWFIGKF